MEKLLINNFKSNNSVKERQHQYYELRRERLRAKHLCLQCKKQDYRTLEGYCHCAECSEKARQRYERKRVKNDGKPST